MEYLLMITIFMIGFVAGVRLHDFLKNNMEGMFKKINEKRK